ncbi:MAG: hypothetical protein ACXVPN_16045 [Bacteroidia bacterium]
MEYVSNDNVNPTIDEVREWGYDEDKSFLDQDEDLILHSPLYIPILIELASDMNCPKTDYCFSILQYYSAIQLSHRTKELADIVSHLRQSSVTSSRDLENWRTKYISISDLVSNPKRLSEKEAEEIAYFLTVGDFSTRDFKKLGTLESGVIEFVASTISYKEYFYIHLETSKWTVSRHTRLTKV